MTPCESQPILELVGVAKRFTLHHQHGAVLPVFDRADFSLHEGECVVLDGPSGMGKSTLLKLVYANYRATAGDIWVRQTHGQRLNVAQASPRELVALRQHTIGYVSQFLRVIPRVSALDVVAEPKPPVAHNPYLHLPELPEFLQKLRLYNPRGWQTQLGVRLLFLTGVRTGELRLAEPEQRTDPRRHAVVAGPLAVDRRLCLRPRAVEQRQHAVMEQVEEAGQRGVRKCHLSISPNTMSTSMPPWNP